MVMVSTTLGLGLGFSLTVFQRRNGPSVKKKKKTGHLIHNNKVQLTPLASFRALHVPGKVSEIGHKFCDLSIDVPAAFELAVIVFSLFTLCQPFCCCLVLF